MLDFNTLSTAAAITVPPVDNPGFVLNGANSISESTYISSTFVGA
jgi:hypothetical protein